MNVVPYAPVFNPLPMLDRLMQVARQNPNAVAHIQRLAQRYGPVAMAHVRQFMNEAGYRAGRAVRDWIGRHVRPRRNQFMHNVRTGLAEQQRVRALRDGHRTVRRYLQYKAPARAIRSVVQSNSAQVRGRRGMNGRRRGGYAGSRGGGRLRRRPMRFGGRPMSRPELKAYDLSTNNPISSTIGLIQVPIRDMSIGTNSNQRVGRKVFAKSLLVAGKIYNTSASTVNTTSDSVWFWIVVDRQANGVASPPATDVWSNTSASQALRNLDQGPRFKILKCVEVKVDAVAVGTHVNQPFEIYIPLNFTVHWKGLEASNVYKNNILIFCGNSNGADDILAVQYATRVRYTDV